MAIDDTSVASALADRVRQGDAAALCDYIEVHRAALMGYVARRLGDLLRSKIEPDDIIQETATTALRCLPTAHLAEREPFGWLCHLADQRIVDAYRTHVRSQKRSAAREARPRVSNSDGSRLGFSQILQASLTTPSQACLRQEQHHRVMAALESLPEEQRNALHMHFLEGLPSKEIARRLGKEDVTIRVMLSRSLRKLRRMLEEEVSTS